MVVEGSSVRDAGAFEIEEATNAAITAALSTLIPGVEFVLNK